MSEKKAMEKENEQVYWILYGVLLAFGVQIVYDFIGLFTEQSLKVVIGGFVCVALLLALLFGGRRMGKKEKTEILNLKIDSRSNKKEDREFQYDLIKVQVDLEFYIAFAIGMLAIAYGLLSYYKDNLLGTVLTDLVVIPFAVVCLILVLRFKERRFKDIKKEYIDSTTKRTN